MAIMRPSATQSVIAALIACTLFGAGCERNEAPPPADDQSSTGAGEDAPSTGAAGADRADASGPDQPQSPSETGVFTRFDEPGDASGEETGISPDSDSGADEKSLTAGGLRFSVPVDWSVSLPEEGMRAAEVALPAPEGVGGDEASLIIFYFGERGAGAAEENLARWGRMIVDDNEQPATPEIGFNVRGALQIYTFESSGTYLSGMPGQTPTPLSDHTMLGAIIEEGPAGPVYLRLTGRSDVVAAHRDAWRRMIESASPSAEPAPRSGR